MVGDIEKYKIPSIAKKGDVLNIDNGMISIDLQETKKKEIEELTKDL